jgi:hypothetical protein|tara:strand:+ start:1981 stop:2190 length:210 start_codon:yes stop_codon:yes gene_type:complete
MDGLDTEEGLFNIFLDDDTEEEEDEEWLEEEEEEEEEACRSFDGEVGLAKVPLLLLLLWCWLCCWSCCD